MNVLISQLNFKSNRSQNLAQALSFSHYEFLLVPCYCPSKLSNEHSYKFSRILTLTGVISIRILRMRIISTIINFYWSHAISLQKLSHECSYKFSRILTLRQVISIRILHMRTISPIMNFYLSHAISLQKLSYEHSYKLAEF